MLESLRRHLRSPIFARTAVFVGILGVYATITTCVVEWWFDDWFAANAGFHAILGIILGSLLGFRTNTSYERWWEGRKLWGQLINDSRNLAIKVQTCVRAPDDEKRLLGRWLIDFAFALNHHLRGTASLRRLPEFAHETREVTHVPAYVASRIYEQLEVWRQADQLGGFELLFLDPHAASLMNICGACERIQKSPISVSYRRFFRQSIAVYLLTLPWGIVGTFGYWTIPAVVLLGYFMIGMEAIAEEIEDPFGVSEDDLLLDDLCKTIESSVQSLIEPHAS